tara:strand:- start:6001 stop:6402 length:402 start_codon:yes stop_codon:yes gene_type:complete
MDIREHLDLVHYEIPRLVDEISNKFGLKIANKQTSVLCLMTLFKDLLFTMKGLQEAIGIMSEEDVRALSEKALKGIYSDHTTILLAVNGIDVNMVSMKNEELQTELIPDYIKYLNIQDFLYEEFYTLLDLINK